MVRLLTESKLVKQFGTAGLWERQQQKTLDGTFPRYRIQGAGGYSNLSYTRVSGVRIK